MDDKTLDRLLKVKAQRDSAFDIKSFGEAENFDVYLKQQLRKYNLTEQDLEKRDEETKVNPSLNNIQNELGKTILVNPFIRANAKSNTRLKWFEDLAELMGSHYGCITEPKIKTGEVIFYGFDLDRELGGFMFLKIADLAYNNYKTEFKRLKPLAGGINPLNKNKSYLKEWMGDEIFEHSFHAGFREAVKEIYKHNKREISIEVKDYYELNKEPKEYNSNYYSHFYPDSNSNEKELEINQLAFDLGRRYGHDSITKAQTTNNLTGGTSLVSKRAFTKTNIIVDSSDSLLILLDNSGSMDYHIGKLEQAKNGTIDLAAKSVEQGFKVGVITFESRVNYLIKFTKDIDDRFKNKVNSIKAMGGTNLTDAIRMAICYFTNSRVKRTICIVTDGMPNDSIGAIEAARDAKRLGIKIIAIGTDDAKQEFLNELVGEGGFNQLVNRNLLQLTIGEMASRI